MCCKNQLSSHQGWVSVRDNFKVSTETTQYQVA